MSFITTDCTSCGCRDAFLRLKGNATGLYCLGCGKWYKWLGKKDVDAYKHRGFKVFSESYSPPNLAPLAPPVDESNSIPLGVPYGQDGAGIRESEVVPSIESIQKRKEPEYHQPVPESLKNFDPCPVCASGVLDPLNKSDDTTASIFQGVLMIRSKDSTELYGSYLIKHCPACGVKL